MKKGPTNLPTKNENVIWLFVGLGYTQLTYNSGVGMIDPRL